MKKEHLQPLIPAALYARLSSNRQDVDLSLAARTIASSCHSQNPHSRGAS